IRNGGAPRAGGVDEELLVAWAPLGDRLRMTSTAEFAGFDRTTSEKSFGNILRMARELFPDAADYTAGERRACLRPMTPDGPPAQSAGPERRTSRQSHAHILRLPREPFPDPADPAAGGRRARRPPMPPDGPPASGRGRHSNLFFNTAHGHMGWTTAGLEPHAI